MTLTLPSERNLAIFHAVVTERLSRRAAAERFGISSTRVQQVLQQVKQFVVKHGAPELLDVAPERIEMASLRLCYEKLTWTAGKLMRAYEDVFSTVDRTSRATGKPLLLPAAAIRMLLSASKIMIDQTRVAARMGKAAERLAKAHPEPVVETVEFVYPSDDEECNTPALTVGTVEAAPAATSPPESGCTVLTETEEKALLASILAAPVTATDNTACDDLFQAMLRRKETRATPAQRHRKRRR